MKRNLVKTLLLTAPLLLAGCFGGSEKKKEDKPPAQDKPVAKQEKPKAQESDSGSKAPSAFDRDTTIEVLTKNLKSTDPRKRAHAALGLAFHQEVDTTDDIERLLRDKSPLVVKSVILALGKLESQDSLGKLFNLYSKTSNVDYKLAILRALLLVQNDDTERFITRFLPEMSPAESVLAYQILAMVETPRKIAEDSGRQSLDSFSISGVVGNGKGARVQIGRAFFGIGDSILGYKITDINVNQRIVSLERDGELFSKEIDASGQNAVEKAIQNLNSENDEVVYKAIQQLAFYRDPKPATELLALVNGKNSNRIKLSAIYAIGVCSIQKAEDELKKLLDKEKRKDFIIATVIALAHIGNKTSIDVIDPFAKHSNPWVRNAAMYALGYFASQHSIGTLVTGLDDEYAFVRQNAYNQLVEVAKAGHKSSIGAILGGYLKNMNPEKEALIAYLETVPGNLNLGGQWGGTKSVAAVAKKKEYKPTFSIIGFGNWGGQQLVTVVEGGVKKNLTAGKTLEGKKIVSIDSDDESMKLEVEKGKIALIIAGEDEASPAEILEIITAKAKK